MGMFSFTTIICHIVQKSIAVKCLVERCLLSTALLGMETYMHSAMSTVFSDPVASPMYISQVLQVKVMSANMDKDVASVTDSVGGLMVCDIRF